MKFQVHEHTVLNSHFSPAPRVVHSHEGGEQPHQHPNCGPAFYGYRVAKFSAKPKGEALPWVDLEGWQRSFEIHYMGASPSEGEPGFIGNGPGTLPAERMIHGFKMRVSRIVDHTQSRGEKVK
jgi:hypothetical protein